MHNLHKITTKRRTIMLRIKNLKIKKEREKKAMNSPQKTKSE
jgi:hypothetical protein